MFPYDFKIYTVVQIELNSIQASKVVSVLSRSFAIVRLAFPYDGFNHLNIEMTHENQTLRFISFHSNSVFYLKVGKQKTV